MGEVDAEAAPDVTSSYVIITSYGITTFSGPLGMSEVALKAKAAMWSRGLWGGLT